MPAAPEQITVESLNDYLEVMTKSVFQSGMSWKVMENKWPGIREALRNFDVFEVANLDAQDLDELAQDTRVIRNRRKLNAIVHNAQRIIELDKAHGSFQTYLRAHGDFDATLKAMKKDFKFMGPTGVYVFLYRINENVIPHEEFQSRYMKKRR